MSKYFTTYSTEDLKDHLSVVIHLNRDGQFIDRIRAIQVELKRRQHEGRKLMKEWEK